ncbi:MAG: signal recognition particle-docking protein FtsY [Spirochaetota bacterium]
MSFADRLRTLLGFANANDTRFFDELADLLIEGDLGGKLAAAAADELRRNCAAGRLSGESEIRSELKKILSSFGKEAAIALDPLNLNVLLVLGVNGVGKTTSVAKLARYFLEPGEEHRIILAAGDTFRAAAIEQLTKQGNRLGIKVIAQEQGSDPAAVIFDAVTSAKAAGARLVIADTAGRMHTRNDLLRELGKIDKVIAAKVPEARLKRLLVIDATTGQNGLRQAEIFGSAVPIDALILTKFDSSAKGGLVLSIAKNLGIPTAFVGTGEGLSDLRAFSLDGFLEEFVG